MSTDQPKSNKQFKTTEQSESTDQSNPNAPDFAFPRDVVEQADSQLAEALAANDGQAIVNALIKSTIASSMISPDSLPAQITHVESLLNEHKNFDAATRSLLNTLLSRMYIGYYIQDSYDLNKRTTVESDDITLWSGNQFKQRISDLVTASLAEPEALANVPIANYPEVINSDELSRLYYPTLLDFTYNEGIETLTRISDHFQQILPVARLINSKPLPSALDPIARQIIELADAWVDANADTQAPLAQALETRFNKISRFVIEPDDYSTTDSDPIWESRIALYMQHADNPYTIELLLPIDEGLPFSQRKQLYDIFTDFKRNNPDFVSINSIDNTINLLKQPNLSLKSPGQVVKGAPFEINAEISNIDATEILIYRVLDGYSSESSYAGISDCQPKPYATIKISGSTDIPSELSATATATINDYGRYILYSPTFDNDSNESYPIFYCSDLALISNSMARDYMAWVVNPMTGHPVKDVLVSATNNRGGIIGTITTGSDGRIELNTSSVNSFELNASKGDDKYNNKLSSWLYNYSDNEGTASLVQTALAVYHPGDTLQFYAIAYNINGDKRSVAPNVKLTAELRNANYQVVNTITATTDDYGRIDGEFILPKDGLTGNYQINVRADSKTNSYNGAAWATVSDYKLPTYQAKVDRIVVEGDDILIHGSARTYSDFPVIGAKVEVNLKATQGWWWYRSSVEFNSMELSTDANGQFICRLTPDIIQQSPYPDGNIKADILVTSPSGENRGASTCFSIGKPFAINTSSLGNIIAEQNAKMPIGLIDRLGENVEGRLKLTFTLNGKVSVVEATTSDGHTVADLSKLTSGTYNVKVEALGVDAKPKTIEQLIIYNRNSKNSPSNDALWVAENRLKVTADKPEAIITYATAMKDVRVLITVNSSDSIISRKWLSPSKGINKIKVKLPSEGNAATVTLTAVRDMKYYNETINIDIIHPEQTLKIKVERMRNRVTPLEQETITLKLTDDLNRDRAAALILDMYCKALDAIEMKALNSFGKNYVQSLSSSNNLRYAISTSFDKEFDWLNVNQLYAPTMNLYGHDYLFFDLYTSFYSSVSSNRHYLRPMKALGAVEERDMIMDKAYVEESVSMDAPSEAATMGAAPTAESQAVKSDNYRPSEIALGFFAPRLTTNPDGSLSYTFTVPNANTTWVLEAFAYDKTLANDYFSTDIISAKPIMVEPNLPRFMRQGDTATILASVMNASDAASLITTTLELLNPADMSLIAEQKVTQNVAAGASEIASFSVEATAEMSTLIVRIKSSTATYSDGVQTILPILPATQQVIDASTFYLTPEQTSFTKSIPATAAESLTTLTFCQNPTWEVVSALPGLISDNNSSSLAASAQIFSAAVSQYVLDLNPAIKPHLKEWLESTPADALSKLNTNEELKQLVLAATPWVSAAASDTERIQHLALLFDPTNIESSINDAVATLAKLQTSSGGWQWSPYINEPSEWATLLILNNFAELKQLGCYPEDKLSKMVTRAWGYVDSQIAKSYERYPNNSYLYYTYVRSLFPEVVLAGSAKRAYDKTLTLVRTQWKSYSTVEKAAAALLLYRNDRKADARTVLRSLRQFATSTPELGMWWDSADNSSWWSLTRVGQTAFILDAFNTIEPGCSEVDKIRQWLILNKIVQDWGSSVNTSACITSILKCGSNWLEKPGTVTLTIGDKTIQPSQFDALTGQFTTEITDATGDISIQRTTNAPAWGALLVRSQQVMTDIKAASIPELSITKEVLVKKGDAWVATDNLAVGQVAKVRLIINSMRDMDYITIVDNRAACMEPVIQTPRPVYCDNFIFYLENRDDRTNLFINRLFKGQYIIEYEMNVNNAGSFSSGIATIQSQYTPEMTAHSAGALIKVNLQQ